jgi:carbonic anhydrase
MLPQFPDPTAPPALPIPGEPRPPGQLGPDQILADLISGNRRFLAGRPSYGHHVTAAVAAVDRAPRAAVMGCMDARVPVEAILDQDFGTVCVTRSAGPVLDRATLASVQLAVATLGVRLVLVLGHRRCVAVAAAIDAQRSGRRPAGQLGFVIEEIGQSITGSDNGLAGHDLADVVTRPHVARTVAQLQATVLSGRSRTDRVGVAGAVYDVDTGWIHRV